MIRCRECSKPMREGNPSISAACWECIERICPYDFYNTREGLYELRRKAKRRKYQG